MVLSNCICRLHKYERNGDPPPERVVDPVRRRRRSSRRPREFPDGQCRWPLQALDSDRGATGRGAAASPATFQGNLESSSRKLLINDRIWESPRVLICSSTARFSSRVPSRIGLGAPAFIYARNMASNCSIDTSPQPGTRIGIGRSVPLLRAPTSPVASRPDEGTTTYFPQFCGSGLRCFVSTTARRPPRAHGERRGL